MSERHGHDHPPQPDHPEPSGYYQLMGVALNELLIEKGVYDADEMRAMIERIESIDIATHGAYYRTPSYREALVELAGR